MSVIEDLRRLREADAGREAPGRVEQAVMEAFRARPRRSKRPWWIAAAAAALLAALALVFIARRQEPARVEPPRVVQLARPVRPEQPVAVRRAVVRRHRSRGRVKPETVAQQFIAIPYAPPLPSNDIQIVRVRLSPAAMQAWASGPASMEADVVTGADGIVRAVRWVR